MKYKPTYGDKQRDEQKRQKDEKLRNQRIQHDTQNQPETEESKHPKNSPDRQDQRVA